MLLMPNLSILGNFRAAVIRDYRVNILQATNVNAAVIGSR